MATKRSKKLAVIDQRAMHKIKDIAHKIWMQTRRPNANLIMFEALRLWLWREGYDPGFEVPDMEADA